MLILFAKLEYMVIPSGSHPGCKYFYSEASAAFKRKIQDIKPHTS